jgi:hypothetical protein
MSTGYTYDLAETNEVVTLKDYIMKCARAMGPMSAMREYRMDAPIPEDLGIDLSYEYDNVQKYKALLAGYERMSLEEYTKIHSERNERTIEEYKKLITKAEKSRRRVQEMIDKVTAWAPPTEDHEPLKIFMLDQLRTTLQYEIEASHWQTQIDELLVRDPAKDFEMDIDNARRSLEYYKKTVAEREKSKAWAINWVKELQASL